MTKNNYYAVMQKCEGGYGYRRIVQAVNREDAVAVYLTQQSHTSKRFLVVDMGSKNDASIYGGAAVYEVSAKVEYVNV